MSEKREDETQTEFALRVIREEWTTKALAAERALLHDEVVMFDLTDSYHDEDLMPTYAIHSPEADAFNEGVVAGYYAAKDRVDALLKGEIKTWTDSKP